MQQIGEDIWVHEDTMTLMGSKLRLRMTIVKLADGKIWVHSPTKLNVDLKQQIEALGPVAYVVAASNGHNTWLCQWHEGFPAAVLYVSAGIPEKLCLADYQLLDEAAETPWQADLSRKYMAAVPFFNESVFLHKKTKSLIVTDLIQNHDNEKPSGLVDAFSQFIFKSLGFKGMCVAPPLKMGFMIKDKAAFAAFIKTVQGWDFERIIVTHGDIIESNAKQVFSDLSARFVK